MLILPEYLLPGRPCPLEVYLFAINEYCGGRGVSQRHAAETARERFGLATFAHTTLGRALKKLCGVIGGIEAERPPGDGAETEAARNDAGRGAAADGGGNAGKAAKGRHYEAGIAGRRREAAVFLGKWPAPRDGGAAGFGAAMPGHGAADLANQSKTAALAAPRPHGTLSPQSNTKGDGAVLGKEAFQIEKMDVACVQADEILSMGVYGRDIELCKRAAKEFGALAPPVVGRLPGGARVVLAGGCEFAALREMGAREMSAAAADIGGEADGAQISLLMAMIRRGHDALCEGMWIRKALDGGGTSQRQICAAIGKSAAWAGKRLSLAGRLEPGVRELVGKGLLDSGSAQAVARLPAEAQCGFAARAVRDGLPKSAVERLVSGFRSVDCPDGVKREILDDPRAELPRFAQKGQARYIPPSLDMQRLRGGGLGGQIAAVNVTMSALAASLHALRPETAAPFAKALSRLAGELRGMACIVQGLVSPGKNEAGEVAGHAH
jgi:ParB family chromosome partitioning protein